jgi:hypothetical protein
LPSPDFVPSLLPPASPYFTLCTTFRTTPLSCPHKTGGFQHPLTIIPSLI